MEKPLWPQWNLLSWFIAPMEKVLFYERLFFEVVIDIVKDIKIQYKRYRVHKISFIHYMKRTREILPLVFKKFELVCALLIYFFSLSLLIGKRSTLTRIWGKRQPPPHFFLPFCFSLYKMFDSGYSTDSFKSLKKSIGRIKKNPEMLMFLPDHLKTKKICKHAV